MSTLPDDVFPLLHCGHAFHPECYFKLITFAAVDCISSGHRALLELWANVVGVLFAMMLTLLSLRLAMP